MGRSGCGWIILLCVAVVLSWTLIMYCIERHGANDMAALIEKFVGLFFAMFTVLGLSLLLMSVGLSTKAELAYDDLMTSCNHTVSDPINSHAEPLIAYYHVLLNLRMQPSCRDLPSIEEC